MVEPSECLVGEVEAPVGDGELRRVGDLLGRVLADEDQDGVRMGDLAGQVVGDAAEAEAVDLGDVAQRLDPVDHNHRALLLGACTDDLLDERREGSDLVLLASIRLVVGQQGQAGE